MAFGELELECSFLKMKIGKDVYNRYRSQQEHLSWPKQKNSPRVMYCPWQMSHRSGSPPEAGQYFIKVVSLPSALKIQFTSDHESSLSFHHLSLLVLSPWFFRHQ